jgi:hypothetical protein
LRACALFNPGDVAASLGAGARYLVGDDAPIDGAAHVGEP